MKIKVTYEKVFDSADHFDPDFEFTAREFNRIIEEYLEEGDLSENLIFEVIEE